MEVQIENVNVIDNINESINEKHTTKMVCKKLRCKERNLHDVMKQIGLKIGKDEFGNRWFTEVDIENIRTTMVTNKTDLLLKIISRSLSKDNPGESGNDQQINLLKEQTQSIIENRIQSLKIELQNLLTIQSESIRDEIIGIYKQNEEHKKMIIELSKENSIESEKEQLFDLLKNQTQFISENIIQGVRLELQNSLAIQAETVSGEVKLIYRQNEELKKKVDELTRMIQITQEGHFKAVDERLHQLIESSKKRGLFK